MVNTVSSVKFLNVNSTPILRHLGFAVSSSLVYVVPQMNNSTILSDDSSSSSNVSPNYTSDVPGTDPTNHGIVSNHEEPCSNHGGGPPNRRRSRSTPSSSVNPRNQNYTEDTTTSAASPHRIISPFSPDNDEDDTDGLTIEDGRDTIRTAEQNRSSSRRNRASNVAPIRSPRSSHSNYYYAADDDDSKVLVDTLRLRQEYEKETEDMDVSTTVFVGLEEDQCLLSNPRTSSHYVVNRENSLSKDTNTLLRMSNSNQQSSFGIISTRTSSSAGGILNTVNYNHDTPELLKYNSYSRLRSTDSSTTIRNSTGDDYNTVIDTVPSTIRTRQTHVSFGNIGSNYPNKTTTMESLSDTSTVFAQNTNGSTNPGVNSSKYLPNYRLSRSGTVLNSIPETVPVVFEPKQEIENSGTNALKSGYKPSSSLPPLPNKLSSSNGSNPSLESRFSISNLEPSLHSSATVEREFGGRTEERYGLGLGNGLELPNDVKLGYGTVMVSTYQENDSNNDSIGYGSQYFDDAGGVSNELTNRINLAAQRMGFANTTTDNNNVINRSHYLNQYNPTNPTNGSAFVFCRTGAFVNTIHTLSSPSQTSASQFHRSPSGPFESNSSIVGDNFGLRLDIVGGTVSDEAATTPSHAFSEATTDSENGESAPFDRPGIYSSHSFHANPPSFQTPSGSSVQKIQSFTVNSNFSKSLKSIPIITTVNNTDMPNTFRSLDRTSIDTTDEPPLSPSQRANLTKKKLFVPTKNGSLVLNGFVVRGEGITQAPADIDYDDMTSTIVTRKNKRDTVRHHIGLALKDTCVRIGILGKGASGCVYKVVHIPTFTILSAKTVPVYVDDKVHRVDRELRALFQNRSQGTVSVSNYGPNMKENKPLESSSSSSPSLSNTSNINNNNDTVIDIATFFTTAVPCPYLLRFYDAFYSDRDDQMVFVTEYMNGGSLQEIIDRPPKGYNGIQSESVLANIAWRLLKGLEYLHQHHMIHRDIKPSNLLINHNGEVKIADFGILQHLKPGQEFARTFTGTTSYMAPERLLGNAYSYNCDIWSAGLSILACSIGRSPFDSSVGYWNILNLLQTDEFPFPQPEKFSTNFRDFLSQCLQKDPAKRPSATVLLQHPFVRNCNSARIHHAKLKGINVLPNSELKKIPPPHRKLAKGVMHDLVDMVKKIQEYRFEAAIRKGHSKIPKISSGRIHNLALQLDIPEEIVDYMFKTSQEKLEEKLNTIREKVLKDRKMGKSNGSSFHSGSNVSGITGSEK